MMKPQALANNTVIYYHTRWTCVSCDTVRGKHNGQEPGVRVEEDGIVPWLQVFLSDEEAQADLQRTSKCKDKTK